MIILICNKLDLLNNKYFQKNKLNINEIYDAINFVKYKKNYLNIFNVENISKKKYLNLINQIKIANNLANITGYDLVTMPIDKSIFKKKISFIGMTEYFGKINKKFTIMLMYGDKFSIIPLTTHINLKKVHLFIKKKIFIIIYKIFLITFKINFINFVLIKLSFYVITLIVVRMAHLVLKIF